MQLMLHLLDGHNTKKKKLSNNVIRINLGKQHLDGWEKTHRRITDKYTENKNL